MTPNLIDKYLDQQQELTAVEKFALQKDMRQISREQARYEELIPKVTPGPGQQYAFAVDLDRCTGCKACVTACHNENGLEEGETWRAVGLIHGGTAQEPTLQHVTSACHHCIDPGCMNGCPVNAYEKDAATGIVKHLEDQCFGCQYCTFMCPYDVPKYIPSKGIVHKCDMCISRLDVGQAPACVRACPNEAIKIALVDTQTVRQNPSEYVKIPVPENPDSRLTIPTTVYTTAKGLPAEMVSVDFYSLKPEHSHAPLVIMLVLTQLSAGAFVTDLFLKYFIEPRLYQSLWPSYLLVAFALGMLALGASVLHLGRPLYAFRAVIGLRTSWLSREIVLFMIFAVLATAYALGSWVFQQGTGGVWDEILAGATALSGLLGVFASVMVYKKTHRPLWDTHLTTVKFFLTALILGIATILLSSMVLVKWNAQSSPGFMMAAFGQSLCFILGGTSLIKLLSETVIFIHLRNPKMDSLKKTALLLQGPLKRECGWRFVCGIAGGVILPAFLSLRYEHMEWPAMLAAGIFIFALSLSGELLERYLFFRAVVPLKMPGERVL